MTKDLNRLTAMEIMGWVKHPDFPNIWFEYVNLEGESCAASYEGDWDPVHDMNQCFQMVAAKLIKDGWGWAIEHTIIHEELKVEIYKDSDPDTLEEMQEDAKYYVCEYYENILDLNRAFLTAALKAKGVEVE